MYTGKNKTAIKSQDMISDALIILLEDKSFSEISITKLCTKALVSRQTFYSLFDNKEDVVHYKFHNLLINFNELFNDHSQITMEWLSASFLNYISNDYNFFKILIDNNLNHIMLKAFSDALLLSAEKIQVNVDVIDDYAVAFMSGALVEITSKYINRGLIDDPKDISNLITKILHGDYFQV